MDSRVMTLFVNKIQDYYDRLAQRVNEIDDMQTLVIKYAPLFDNDFMGLLKADQDLLSGYWKYVFDDEEFNKTIVLYDEVKYCITVFDNFKNKENVSQYNMAVTFLQDIYAKMVRSYERLQSNDNVNMKDGCLLGMSLCSEVMSSIDENGFCDKNVDISKVEYLMEQLHVSSKDRCVLLLSLYKCRCKEFGESVKMGQVSCDKVDEEVSEIDYTLYMDMEQKGLYKEMCEFLARKSKMTFRLDPSVKLYLKGYCDAIACAYGVRNELVSNARNMEIREALLVMDMERLMEEIRKTINEISDPRSECDSKSWMELRDGYFEELKEDKKLFCEMMELLTKNASEDNLEYKVIYLKEGNGRPWLQRDIKMVNDDYLMEVSVFLDELKKGVFNHDGNIDAMITGRRGGIFVKSDWKLKMYYMKIKDVIVVMGVALGDSLDISSVYDRKIDDKEQINRIFKLIQDRRDDVLLQENRHVEENVRALLGVSQRKMVA